jgi:prolyl-tRNA editing enzyme YbaK/EbsC (Cys-tRNA(Pro) deacylase)
MIDPNLAGRERVDAALKDLRLDAEIVSPGVPMPTVPLAAEAVGCSVDQIIKTVVFTTPDGLPVIAIANGTSRIDRKLLAAAVGITSLKLADPDFVCEKTGFPAGGIAPIGIRAIDAPVVIDPAVLAQRSVYGGAGTEDDLLHLATIDLIRVTGACICLITRQDSPL